MSTTKFFFPSTAYRGRNPRLRIPSTDPGLPDEDWIPGAISTGTDLQWFLQVLEPLLTSVYVAGYGVPQISVLSISGTLYGGGLQYDTESSRVVLLDKQAAESEFGTLPSSPCVYLKMIPIWAQGPTGVVNRAVDLAIDGVSPGLPESRLSIAAGSGSGLRDSFRLPVVDLTNRILVKLAVGTGLLGIYDYATWNLSLLDDLELAVYNIATYFLPQAMVDSLRMDLGNLDPDGSAGALRLYRYLTSTERLHNRERERRQEKLVGDTEDLQAKLSAALAFSGLEADYFGDVPYTMLLLELYSRGVIDILREVDGPGGITDSQVAAILAKPSPLQAADIETLCTYLSSGTGAQMNNVSTRLPVEYSQTTDNALRGLMVQAVIDVCTVAAPVPLTNEQTDVTPGSFEFHLAQLVAFTNCEVNDGSTSRIAEFTQDLWQRWQSGLGNADTAEKFHYGAARLFLMAPDYEVEFLALQEMATYYGGTVAEASQDRWRFTDAIIIPFTPPVGWSDLILAEMIDCYRSLPADLHLAEMSSIYANLERLVGQGIFQAHGHTMDQVNEHYAAVFQQEFDRSSNGSALSDYGFLTMAMVQRLQDDDFAARFRIDAATNALFEIVNSNRDDISATLFRINQRAAEETVGLTESYGFSNVQEQWFKSPATQNFLNTLDAEKRRAFEHKELELLELLYPEAAKECLDLSIANALIAQGDQFLAEQDLNVLEAGIQEIWVELGISAGVSEARNAAKFLKDGLKATVDKPLFNPKQACTYRDVARARYLLQTKGVVLFSWDVYVDLRSEWNWDQADVLEFRIGSNFAAVLAALLAGKQLADMGFAIDAGSTITSIGLLRDVATGAQAGTEISISLINAFMRGYTDSPELIPKMDQVMTVTSTIGKYLSCLSSLISIASNGYAAKKALEAGEYKTGLLLVLATATNVYCFSGALWTLVTGSTFVFPAMPVIAAVGAGLVLTAALLPVIEAYVHQNQFNTALVRYQAIWDESVALALPVGVDVVRDLERIDLTYIVHPFEPLIEVITPSDWDYFEMPWSPNTDKLQILSTFQESYLCSPIPGDVEWREFYRNADHFDIGENILTLHPLLEYTIRADSAGVVVVNICSPGDIVDRSDPVIEVDQGEFSVPLAAPHGGMIVEALPAGNGFSANDVLCRIRLDYEEVIVGGDR